MCVRACAIGVRLPSPRALTGSIYIISKTAQRVKRLVARFSETFLYVVLVIWNIMNEIMDLPP